MANLFRSKTILFLVVALVGFLSSAPATARPCKTLFITFSIEPLRVNRPNPNFIFIKNPTTTDDHPSLTVFSEQLIRPEDGGLFLIDRPDFPNFEFERLPTHNRLEEHQPQQPSFLGLFPLPRVGIDFDSLFDRSKDVLSVVVALLFGVGCGALTAATMYFAWMLVVGRGEDEEYYSDYDEIPSPKKGGYVTIPAPVKDVA